jgi:hypothetical protein
MIDVAHPKASKASVLEKWGRAIRDVVNHLTYALTARARLGRDVLAWLGFLPSNRQGHGTILRLEARRCAQFTKTAKGVRPR